MFQSEAGSVNKFYSAFLYYSDCSFSDNSEISSNRVLIFFKQSLEYSFLVCSPFVIKAQKYNSFMRFFISEYQFAKILVVCDQDTVFSACFLNNLSIISTLDFIIYRNHWRNHSATAGPVTHPQGIASNKPLLSKA